MTSNKPIVQLLIQFLEQTGVRHIVIAPGSRNAPLIIAFTHSSKFTCYSIVDERSAGYYALGMARQLDEPVVVVCTSGTAVLNLAPALAEAFYQEIKLIAITADRPAEWIDQEDGQTIRQQNIFNNFIKYSCNLPGENTGNALDEAFKELNQVLVNLMTHPSGPIHINIPLQEPLYDQVENMEVKANFQTSVKVQNEAVHLDFINEIWLKSQNVLLVAGVMLPDSEMNRMVNEFSDKLNIPVIASATSNLSGNNIINVPDSMLASIDINEWNKIKPDLLITIGGSVISKRLKEFLRLHKPNWHIDIDINPQKVDTYRCLTHKITSDPAPVLSWLLKHCEPKGLEYLDGLVIHTNNIKNKSRFFFDDLLWSDLYIFNDLLNHKIPKADLHLANSTPVRFAELFDKKAHIHYYSNRGTSGIDGCLSTAAGAAMVSDHLVFIITGDVGFFYDANAFFNKQLPKNLKVILINNGGGGIFEILPGPPKTDVLDYFKTPHQYSARSICEAFGVKWFYANSIDTFNNNWKNFMETKICSVIELDTTLAPNTGFYHKYFSGLKTS